MDQIMNLKIHVNTRQIFYLVGLSTPKILTIEQEAACTDSLNDTNLLETIITYVFYL